MKVACLVNNYQYGEPRFEKMKQQFAYQDEQLDDKHHVVFLDVSDDDFKFLKQLLKSDLHNNVNKKSAFSEKGWIEMYKQRLHPKVNEDIEVDVDDDEEIIPQEALDYVSVAHDEYNQKFYIIWDAPRVEKALGVEGEPDSVVEETYDLFFGMGQWGYEDDYYICDNCRVALPSWDGDYLWLDSGCYCMDCIRSDEWVAEEYLEYCINNRYANYEVDADMLDRAGYHQVAGPSSRVNENSATFDMLDNFIERFGGNFILCYTSGWLDNYRFSIWTDNNEVTEDNFWEIWDNWDTGEEY